MKNSIKNSSKSFFIFALSLCFFNLLNSSLVLASELSKPEVNAQKFGFLTLLPPIIAIVLAFIFKNVVISLFLGLLVGGFLLSLNGFNIFPAIINSFTMIVHYLLNSLADPWNAGIILQCLTIGGLISLISKMGGTKAVAEALAKKAKTPRSTQIVTWLLGILVFFDDYANSLIVGPIMRPVCDNMKVSREKLSFIVDSTAAPISGIAVISTWIGYELSLIKDGFSAIGVKENSYNIFIQTIPYRFYNILILAFIVISAILLREFGPMYKSEYRARTTGETLRPGSSPLSSEDKSMEPKEGIKLSIWNAITPILVLIISSFIGFYFNGYNAIMSGDNKEYINLLKTAPTSFSAIQATFGQSDASIVLFSSALFSSIVAMIMGCTQKIFTLGEAIETWIEGMKSLIITGVILLLAWSLSSIIKELGTAPYLVSILSKTKMPTFILPSIVFILSAIISFATGTSYGTMGILMPLTIPLSYALNADHNYVVLCISAILTGSIFGDHCSPISDTTILSSMGSSCDHLDHVSTQLPYALVVGAISVLFGYIPSGLGMPIYLTLPICLIIVFLVLKFIGKPVPNGLEASVDPDASLNLEFSKCDLESTK
ncbi:Na+/H+ antiporter NhaC family protein [Hathewaya massiliensis]|uniref:Na+/H+ antiporter NhaC family protein n=1 Tax=Hathewaya massiliensis TaxID=1964382 RepID=UPI001156CD98|nr:Na+/H+ antiporter NhaC family protein [Hathewaya massiliensis]